jgi:hypothetical protein
VGVNAQTFEDGQLGPEAELALAKRVREAVLEIEGVAGIGEGRLAEVATRWLGEKVLGVVVRAESIEVHVVAYYPGGFPAGDLADRVRAKVEPLAGGRRLDVVVDDLIVADEDAPG